MLSYGNISYLKQKKEQTAFVSDNSRQRVSEIVKINRGCFDDLRGILCDNFNIIYKFQHYLQKKHHLFY
jgi:hypothetical protein